MSEGTLGAALRRLGYESDAHVPHGFRSSFSTMANESGLWRSDIIETALAHGDENKIRATYNRADYELGRRQLAQWWADRCDELKEARPAKVVAFRCGRHQSSGLRRSRETLHDFHELVVRNAAGIPKFGKLMFVREPVQAHELPSALTPVQLQLGWSIGEKKPPHFRRAQEMSEFRRSDVDQKEHEHPEGNRAEAPPSEVGDQIGREITRPVPFNYRETHETLDQPRNYRRNPIASRLEQDWLDERSPVEDLDEWHRIRSDHGIADDKRGHCSKHEITDGDGIVGDEEVCRQNNEVETDEEEDRRR
jgi:hypothetical protein